jgi:hypothetical protein
LEIAGAFGFRRSLFFGPRKGPDSALLDWQS